MKPDRAVKKRCAIYTRKSSEEGLEQDFNSLDAQREACEAFIQSQRGEGWRLVPTRYDDGGISGASMDRPALQWLLDEIRTGRVDVVVVYKVDRLTRSLADFARMVEVFDERGVSFVAVTQQFNTTSSMGRLTLNVLLSFAQFEREVTGERIRDKIAASKRKGIWMGGAVPLGYDVNDRKLVVNAPEAATVRMIFQRYLEFGCVRRLKDDLNERGVRSKRRISKSGKITGGAEFSRGALYTLLSNPMYIGKIRHKGESHPGQHDPIMDMPLWDAVQAGMTANRAPRQLAARKVDPSPLAGKLFDEEGGRLTPSHAVKNGRRYRYYVSRRLVTGVAEKTSGGWRLPAWQIEEAVAKAASDLFRESGAIAEVLREADVAADQIPDLLGAAAEIGERVLSPSGRSAALVAVVQRVELDRQEFQLTISLANLGEGLPTLSRKIPLRIRQRGIEMRLVINGDQSKPDSSLEKAISRGRKWFEDIALGHAGSIAEIALLEGVTARYVSRLLPLAFLAPTIVEDIARGRQPPQLTTESLTTGSDLPLDWLAQGRILEM